MNIIEISNQLKDVPDQFLMKEVQAPSGAYPSYLVISELTRRKRMRESALKEAPQTTVAQDLADPGREQRQMAMAQAAQQMAAPSLNAGLAAAPQAMESLAAQDAMALFDPLDLAPLLTIGQDPHPIAHSDQRVNIFLHHQAPTHFAEAHPVIAGRVRLHIIMMAQRSNHNAGN